MLYKLAGAGVLWVRVAQALIGAASCVLIALAGRTFFGDREGWAAGLLLAVYPPAIFFDGEIQKASFDLFFGTTLLLLIARIRDRPTVARVVAAGFAAGLFALNRENALILLPLLTIWLVAVAGRPG